jgi:hypothetical protein
MRGWQFQSFLALVMASGWLLQSCVTISGTPTGSAASLNETRLDENAELEAAGKKIPNLQKQNSDISAFLNEVTGIPPEPFLIHDQVNDAQAKIYSQAFKMMVSNVKNAQVLLENYKDVASFLNANYGKSGAELEQAAREYGSRPDVTPIALRILKFREATQKINTEIAKYQRTYSASSPNLINPLAYIASGMNSSISSLATRGLVEVCLDYSQRGAGRRRIDLLNPKGRDCIVRTVREHRQLQSLSKARAALHEQATGHL